MNRGLAISIVVLALTACSSSEGPASAGRTTPAAKPESRQEARSDLSWKAPDDYRFVVDSECGERDFIGRFVITVEDGRAVTPAVGERSDKALAASAPRDVPTLEELLKEARDAELSGADHVEVEFDESDGHPAYIEIDYDKQGIDDEACYSIVDFEEL